MAMKWYLEPMNRFNEPMKDFIAPVKRYNGSMNYSKVLENHFKAPMKDFIASVKPYIGRMNYFKVPLNTFNRPMKDFIAPMERFIASLNRFDVLQRCYAVALRRNSEPAVRQSMPDVGRVHPGRPSSRNGRENPSSGCGRGILSQKGALHEQEGEEADTEP